MANIILDYDGTIHDCAKIYVPAFYTGYKYLTDRGLAPVHEYSYNEVSGYTKDWKINSESVTLGVEKIS